MLNEEVAKYRELSGDTNPNVPISRIGGYLDGYEKALEQEPCGDAISRQDALRAFMYATNGERLPDYDCDNYPVTYDLRYIKKTLRALPPVTPQPKTGHWIEDTNGTYTDNHDTWECSECGNAQILLEGTPKDNDYNYCPNCGYRMGEPQERNGEE